MPLRLGGRRRGVFDASAGAGAEAGDSGGRAPRQVALDAGKPFEVFGPDGTRSARVTWAGTCEYRASCGTAERPPSGLRSRPKAARRPVVVSILRPNLVRSCSSYLTCRAAWYRVVSSVRPRSSAASHRRPAPHCRRRPRPLARTRLRHFRRGHVPRRSARLRRPAGTAGAFARAPHGSTSGGRSRTAGTTACLRRRSSRLGAGTTRRRRWWWCGRGRPSRCVSRQHITSTARVPTRPGGCPARPRIDRPDVHPLSVRRDVLQRWSAGGGAAVCASDRHGGRQQADSDRRCARPAPLHLSGRRPPTSRGP